MFKYIVIIGILAMCGRATQRPKSYVSETIDVNYRTVTIFYSSEQERAEIIRLVRSN